MGDAARQRAVKCDRVGHLPAEETCAGRVIDTVTTDDERSSKVKIRRDKNTWTKLALRAPFNIHGYIQFTFLGFLQF